MNESPQLLWRKKRQENNNSNNIETTQEEDSSSSIVFLKLFSTNLLKTNDSHGSFFVQYSSCIFEQLKFSSRIIFSIYSMSNSVFSLVGLRHVKGILLFGPPGNIQSENSCTLLTITIETIINNY